MRTAKSGSPVRKLIENKKPVDSADILTDTNNNEINRPKRMKKPHVRVEVKEEKCA